ncbi:hydrogenase nickel incorporation protein HypA [Cephaloticoccus primus]|uniref:Hydrogenase nickel incorporation protein HypA n=1 Tax=Cephaloticoccus primus TaxID=1548207 RepID=A0A139SKL4_9BACT|nr:hydrogenase nickel incorporation protein HypA [Cephaloticoccus primus]KXU35085.1 hydrogenase nickel incorporation protein HypA [Cephaloticoccus primus]
MTFSAVLYCIVIGLFFLGLWLYYDRRDHKRFERKRRRCTFHCIRCNHLYQAPADASLAKCPHCGHENSRLRF